MVLFSSSGGRTVMVTGKNLRLAQRPMMIIYSGESNFTEVSETFIDANFLVIWHFYSWSCMSMFDRTRLWNYDQLHQNGSFLKVLPVNLPGRLKSAEITLHYNKIFHMIWKPEL